MTTDQPLTGRFADVLALFSDAMRAANYSDAQLDNAARLWRDFVQGDHAPRFRKPAVFAAAVEYTIARLDHVDLTQADVARRYDTSEASISKNHRLIADALHVEVFDPRYSSVAPSVESLVLGPDGSLSPAAFFEMMNAVQVNPDLHNTSPLTIPPPIVAQILALPQTDPAWFGGRRSINAFIAQEPPIRPEFVVWGSEQGLIGQEMLTPGDGDVAVLESLLATCFEPALGEPRRPHALHLEDERLTARLRDALALLQIEIVAHPLPVLDELFAHMDDFLSQTMSDTPDFTTDYLFDGEVSRDTARAFFEAAAQLARAAPWEIFQDDLFITIDLQRWGTERPCAALIGQAGQERGILIFDSVGDCTDFRSISQLAFNLGVPPAQPNLNILALNFETGADIPSEARKQIMRYGWPVASADDHPALLRFNGDGAQPIQPDDCLIATAMIDAVLHVINDPPQHPNPGTYQIQCPHLANMELSIVTIFDGSS